LISKEDYKQRLTEIIRLDGRYEREAYNFVLMSINFSITVIVRRNTITAKELLDGMRIYSLEKFGPMSRMVMEHWGVFSCKDFGEIVLNLINKGIVEGAIEHVVEEFEEVGFDFTEAFEEPYRDFSKDN